MVRCFTDVSSECEGLRVAWLWLSSCMLPVEGWQAAADVRAGLPPPSLGCVRKLNWCVSTLMALQLVPAAATDRFCTKKVQDLRGLAPIGSTV